jgi:alanine dehydrogenase
MRIGVLKEIKNGEYRVIMTPLEAATLIADGHEVYLQNNAGLAAGFRNADYEAVGVRILPAMEDIYAECDFVTKVKEFEPCEYPLMREGQILFTCIHPAAHPGEVDALLEKKVTSFSAEDSHRYGSPNCEAAGKAGVFMGLYAMMSMNGGCGKFVSGLGAAPNVRAMVLGCGTVGKAAIDTLYRMGAWVSVAATNIGHLRHLNELYHGEVSTFLSSRESIKAQLPNVDMLVNCVRWPKDATEFLVDRAMVASMPHGAVIVDISNDYGVIETFHETTHADPMYIEEGVVHYCVSNIPAAIAGSTSVAYAASVLPHFRSILNNGVAEACARDGFLRRSLTTCRGYLTHEETSGIQHRPWVRPEDILGIADRPLDPAPPATHTRSDLFYEKFC